MPWIERSLSELKPCVYVIYIDNSLHYIGQTSNLEDRLLAHRSGVLRGIESARIRVKYKILEDVAARTTLEGRLIRRYRPKANKQIPRDLRIIELQTRLGYSAPDYIKLPSRMK